MFITLACIVKTFIVQNTLCIPSSFYIGAEVRVIIADLDMLKEITVKQFDIFPDRVVRHLICMYKCSFLLFSLMQVHL